MCTHVCTCNKGGIHPSRTNLSKTKTESIFQLGKFPIPVHCNAVKKHLSMPKGNGDMRWEKPGEPMMSGTTSLGDRAS